MELTRVLRSWVDSDLPGEDSSPEHIDWVRVVPFIGLHLGCLGTLWVGASPAALAVAAALFALRMFAVTAFYHRYFSHRAFRASRAAQFVFALLGASAVQRGPLWWASHHRHHHAHADRPEDAHSARQHGFLWSHCLWFLAAGNVRTRAERVRDLARYPELRLIDRFDVAVPIMLGIVLWSISTEMFVWGFCVSTVALYHATFTINSLAHRYGSRRYATRDDSRNNWWLALLTFGEGWHNNHHRHPGSARQGLYWWELDFTYYALRGLAALGIVWDLNEVRREDRDRR